MRIKGKVTWYNTSSLKCMMVLLDTSSALVEMSFPN